MDALKNSLSAEPERSMAGTRIYRAKVILQHAFPTKKKWEIDTMHSSFKGKLAELKEAGLAVPVGNALMISVETAVQHLISSHPDCPAELKAEAATMAVNQQPQRATAVVGEEPLDLAQATNPVYLKGWLQPHIETLPYKTKGSDMKRELIHICMRATGKDYNAVFYAIGQLRIIFLISIFHIEWFQYEIR